MSSIGASSDLCMPGRIESSSGKYLDLPKESQQEALGIYSTCRMTIL